MKPTTCLAGTLLFSILHYHCGQLASQTPTANKHSGPSAALDSIGAVSWTAIAGNKYFAKNANEFYVYLSLKGNDVVKNSNRVPLNISLVLDRSGSMQGDKIAYAKKAADFVVDQLKDDDILSIVNYDDRIELSAASQPVKNKEILKKKIDALYDRGSTNLTGGMLEGFNQVKSTKRDGYVNRVLLLTDGLANVGITDPDQMKKLVQQKYSQDGIALSTFGLGADYNENLLTMLAEMGRANYYFIASADKIPNIFASELKGLLSVVAQNAIAQVEFPSNLECVKVYGYAFDINKNVVSVHFNDLYASDEKGILLKFKKKSDLPEKMNFHCSLKYVDANSFENVTDSKEVGYNESNDLTSIEKNKNPLVEEMIALYESTEMFDDIMARVDAGDYQGAKLVADSAVIYLKMKQQYIRSDKLQKQEKTIGTYSYNIDSVKVMKQEDMKLFQKSNKAQNYSVKKGKQ